MAPSTIESGENTVASVGAGAAVTVKAPDTAALLPTAVLRMLDVLLAAPTVTDVTGIVTLQLAPAPTVAPLSEIALPPAVAPKVPPHEFVAAGVDAIKADVGTLSVNEIPAMAAEPAALLIVYVISAAPPCAIVAGAMDSENNGGLSLTFRTAVWAEATAKPFSFSTLEVLVYDAPAPLASTVTVTVNEQLWPAVSVPPVKEIDEVPDTVAPAPQAPAPGTPDNVAPVMVPPTSSRNSRSLSVAPPTGLSIV